MHANDGGWATDIGRLDGQDTYGSGGPMSAAVALSRRFTITDRTADARNARLENDVSNYTKQNGWKRTGRTLLPAPLVFQVLVFVRLFSSAVVSIATSHSTEASINQSG